MISLPPFSIVILTKNNEETIDECLKSVFHLNYPRDKLEVVVVDAYSKDGTLRSVKKYPIKLFFDEGKGISRARNIGWRNSQGEYVIFLDADAKLHSNYIKEVLKIFSSDVGIVHVPPIPYSIHSWVARASARHIQYSHPKKPHTKIRRSCALTTSTVKREALEKVNGFDERIIYGGDDVDLTRRISLKGWRIVVAVDAIAYHMPRQTLRGLCKEHFGYGRGRSILYRKYQLRELPPLSRLKSIYRKIKLRDPILIILHIFSVWCFTLGFLVGLLTWAKEVKRTYWEEV